jgi:peptidyl-prolyl cis-trans isomerase D
MLKQFSRMEKTRNWIIILFAALMGLSLIFFYAPGGRGALSPLGANNEVVAEVRGDEITVGDLNRAMESTARMQQMFGGQFSMAGRERMMLDGVISSRIVRQEAARLKLWPSDEELRTEIRRQFKDASGNFIGVERYQEQVSSLYGTVEKFEDELRTDLARQKLSAFVGAGVQVSEAEVQREFERANTSFDIVYVPVTAAQLAVRINPSEEEARRFYDEHQTDFRVLEPTKKIRYVFIEQAKVGEKIPISDEDLRAEYDKLSPEHKMAGVRVQQIVLKVPTPEDDQRVLMKATELAQRIRDQQGNATEEAFAEAARGNSEDPATAEAGGWLPAPVRRNPNKPDLLQNTLSMQAGQVSDPLKTGNAYYIFRRGEAIPKTFEDAKKEIEVSLRNRKSYAAAAQLAQRIAARLKEVKDVQKVAEEFAAEANMSVAEMVRETPFIKPKDNVPDIGSSQDFENAIEPLKEKGDVGNRVSIKNGFAAPMLVDQRPPNVIPEFAEIREQVNERIRQTRAKEQLEQTARELAAGAGDPEALKAAAERLGLKAETSEGYKLGATLTQVGTTPAIEEAVYALKAGEVTKTPVKSGDAYVVIGASKRTDADLAEFGKQRDQLIETALMRRRTEVFGDYVAALRTKLERDGEIEIYEDVLARATATDDAPAATRATLPTLPTQTQK